MGPVSALETLSGWGRHPVRQGHVIRPERLALPAGAAVVVPRGLGRAYGDAALPAARDDVVVETVRADRILAFDEASGRLRGEAGLTLEEIIRVFLPRGWFPPVTPGTKFVTIGGCVACDVHGKNHHRDGSFGRFVEAITLAIAEGGEVVCGPDRERELFHATVGGMGLTGLILDVTLRLTRVESAWIVLETEGVPDLSAMVSGLRGAADEGPYTVG
ncbi:MAG TPA: FAD-binding oxidoreductase, partial [Candidatus Limnocylindrales bacterium]|nr:FAD-binding oxidoreductase [Candidatus Limnocylindrales bacterium]